MLYDAKFLQTSKELVFIICVCQCRKLLCYVSLCTLVSSSQLFSGPPLPPGFSIPSTSKKSSNVDSDDDDDDDVEDEDNLVKVQCHFN